MADHSEDLLNRIGQLDHSVNLLMEKMSQLQDDLDARFSGFSQRLGAVEAQVKSANNSSSIEALHRALVRIASPTEQGQILDVLLDEASDRLERAALFVHRGNVFSLHSSRGMDSVDIPPIPQNRSEHPVVKAAASRQSLILEGNLTEQLSWISDSEGDRTAITIPLNFDRQVPLVLYADSRMPFGPTELEFLCDMAVLVLKNHYLTWRLQKEGGGDGATSPAIAPEGEPQADGGELSIPASEAAPSSAGVAGSFPGSWAESAEDRPAAGATGWSGLSSPQEAEIVGNAAVETIEEKPDTGPQGVVPESPPAAGTVLEELELERLESEARRFARLLISEIKLYNETLVEEGRANGDLYTRLRRDIERSREMYNKRAHPTVRGRTDFFHQELVRILAMDNDSLLGPEYPGPEV